MEFLEILGENWFEILSAVGTIAAIFFTRNARKTAAEKHEAKVKKMEAKVKKEAQKTQADNKKLEELKKEGVKNA